MTSLTVCVGVGGLVAGWSVAQMCTFYRSASCSVVRQVAVSYITRYTRLLALLRCVTSLL